MRRHKVIVGDLIDLFSRCFINVNDNMGLIYSSYFKILEGDTVHFFGTKEGMIKHYDDRLFEKRAVEEWSIRFIPDKSKCVFELHIK